ncbi:MAG: hypothetical protein AAGG44_03780, partial [Planctomycetota bacterium]
MQAATSKRSWAVRVGTAMAFASAICVMVFTSSRVDAQETKRLDTAEKAELAKWQNMVDRSVAYLRQRGQASDGS